MLVKHKGTEQFFAMKILDKQKVGAQWKTAGLFKDGYSIFTSTSTFLMHYIFISYQN
jgi:hypothetical protein